MIEIFVTPSENLGLVWNADDWLKLRQNYRIVGNLIGSLSKYPRQNSFNGLPLCLQPEEVSLLKEKGFVKLILCSSLSSRPADNLYDAFEKEENVFNEAQKQRYVLKKKAEVEKSYDSIVEGKTKKRRIDSDTSDKNVLINEEVNKIQSVSSNSYLSCISVGKGDCVKLQKDTALKLKSRGLTKWWDKIDLISDKSEFVFLPADPWIKDDEKLEADWTYPDCERERLKYDVFKDLWQKNYYITSGTKFGGDYLCYSGDPAKFHAEFIVFCVQNQEKLSAKQIVTLGRIGTSTKKTFSLATKIEGNIVYQSLQWMDGSN